MKPGNYVFMVDPIWNASANNDEKYRDVLVDIYAPELVKIQPIEDFAGL